MPKARMFGAGITNNLVFGFSCFVLLILMMGMVVPAQQPVIYGVYKNYPAENAGVPSESVIRYIEITNTSPYDGNVSVVLNPNSKSEWSFNDTESTPETGSLLNLATGNTTSSTGHLVSPAVRVPVSSREQVSTLLNATKPGDRIVLGVEKNDVINDYPLNLSHWPTEAGARESGFMGITYYDGALVKSSVGGLLSPVGFFQFLIIPFGNDQGTQFLRIIAFETTDTRFYQVPFAGFWGVIHLLFWCAWININVGIFNAIPMVPLDGGYIFKVGVDRLLERRGLIRFSGHIVSAVSYVMIVVLMSLIFLPYLMHM
jgi:membrane-associated protease RseP (regulator of RpoE activity)